MKEVIFAGSLDLITRGHFTVIDDALRGFDKVIILVATNPEKDYMFSADERVEVVRQATKHLGDRVEVVKFSDGFIANFARRRGITAQIRGVRSLDDYLMEADNAEGNRKINPDLATYIVFAPKEAEIISSSFVKKQIYGPRGWVDEMWRFAPDATVRAFARRTMREKWAKLMADLEVEGPFDEEIEELISGYDAAVRHYHGPEHIVRGLDELDEWALQVGLGDSNLARVKFAWFFHDLFQNGAEPEERSARELLKVGRKLGLEAEFLERAMAIVMATTHRSVPSTFDRSDESLAMSVDLAIFGQNPEIYDRYVAAVRREYVLFTDEEFAFGRVKVLSKYLDREAIYSVREFHDKYEARARENLERELKSYLAT